ncbi:phospholipid scramblase 1-like [Sceloporus undulatus]|uniref:phospholipid scramblase 1-like n=1 Tax=Sceloporus undulatus TaxID=8520 RepID=UPI001C4D2E6A|nr:phospholipid scramblase 1-like [Sceloporus undulatus]XP_042322117.1 phospholipid scramblase 1-like [Sceloporus undulatus]
MQPNPSASGQAVPRHPRPQTPRRQSIYFTGPRFLGVLERPANPNQTYAQHHGIHLGHRLPHPQAVTWMPAPLHIPNCPPGLEYLSQIDRLLIHQQIELLEVLTSFETCNRYEIRNDTGQRMYLVIEENNFCTLFCCGAARPFTIKIFDNMGHNIIQLMRPYRCSTCWYPCCLQELEVHAPPGTPIGYVKQTWDPCLPKFTLQNEAKEDMLKIVGPCIVCSCGADIRFDVMSLDETCTVGRISKLWTGFLKELFTDADDIGVQFPPDLDIKMKAVVLGAAFLIDFMFFEHSHDRHQQMGVW